MRGQRITEQEPLIADPSAFGITLCTPDMLLSRLLFSSYSSGHRLHSREAGLIQDSYIVLDEVHISEPARRTLEYVNAHNRHGIKNWWYTCMTATPRNDCKNELGLSEDDRLLMKARLNAHKRLNLVEGNVLDTIKNVKHDWQRMIIYVEQPAHATRLRVQEFPVREEFKVNARHGHDKYPCAMFALEFAQEVSGVVSLGMGRFTGLGIFANRDDFSAETRFAKNQQEIKQGQTVSAAA